MKSELTILSYTPAEIAAITGGTLAGGTPDARVTSVCTDSRETSAGSLFCAIRGERTDGHMYISQACAAGAACVLAEEMPETAVSCAVIVVKDTIRAIGDLAAHYRDQAQVRVIAVTGSVGKTTTKEFISAVAAAGFPTHKTEGNHNNDLGLSMTLFRLEPHHRISVLEMGMSNLGEIERMSQMAKPDIALITNIGTSHLASLGTRENICRAKLEITAGMKPQGIVLLNADEPLLYEQAGSLEQNVQLLSIGSHHGDYRAVNIRSQEDGMLFDMICRDTALTNIGIPTLGKHNVYNALAAYAVGYILGLSEETIREGLMQFRGADMRQKIYPLGDITVIEDCYNASPESMRAALDVLASISARAEGCSAALLGDMLELGEYSRLMHDQLGQYVAHTKVQKLFCYGMMADVVAEAAIKNGIRAENVFVSLDTSDPQTMAKMILQALHGGDVLLVKASRGVAAERVIECMKNPRLRKK
ncbi:MAG: UDP-N-acetylmuramoyl-tripeptide--D-alanyl-D-alanine ligase [Ruminococcaceae bacterium]|nr:UDP-N-acetylmuramoyl-tripeptide--D-alanyl-D-alanine ligase [Oscillospiraceae bacterium]